MGFGFFLEVVGRVGVVVCRSYEGFRCFLVFGLLFLVCGFYVRGGRKTEGEVERFVSVYLGK